MGCTGNSEAIDGADGGAHDQGDIYCVICYETGALEIFDAFSLWINLSREKLILLIPSWGNLPEI